MLSSNPQPSNPNSLLFISRCFTEPYYNWTSYAVHYKGSGDGEEIPRGYCKLIPKVSGQIIFFFCIDIFIERISEFSLIKSDQPNRFECLKCSNEIE